MKVTIGFLFTSSVPKKIPTSSIIQLGIKNRIYVMNSIDDNLVTINGLVQNEIDSNDQFKALKYDILSNLCFFPDEKRVEGCDLVIKVDENNQNTLLEHPLSQQSYDMVKKQIKHMLKIW